MSKTANYLKDLGVLISENAIKAKAAKEAASGTEDNGFQAGYLAAYHEVVDLMQQQADVFGIAHDAIGLESINSDRDLL